MAVELIITLRKSVADQAAAQALYDQIKVMLVNKPGIKLSAHTSTHFAQDEIEEP